MIRLWAISTNTFLQTIRQPIFLVMILATAGLMVLTMPFSGYTMSVDFAKTDLQLLQDLGLGTLRISSLLIAAFSAAGVLRREIEEKTALIVITKPVRRSVFVVGKFVGVLLAVALAYYICSLVLLMTVRHKVVIAKHDPLDWVVITLGLSALGATLLVTLLGNLLFGWGAIPTAVCTGASLLTGAMAVICMVGKEWELIPFGQGIDPQLVLQLGVMFLASVVFVAMSVAASTRLNQTMTLLVCLTVFLLGSAHPQIIGAWADDAPVIRFVGWLLPDFSQFYPQDDLSRSQGPLPWSLVARAAGYCLLYSAGLIALAIAIFQTRELEAQESSSGAPGAVNFLALAGRAGAVACALMSLSILTVPRLYSTDNLIRSGILAAAALVLWVVSAGLGRGRAWSWYVVLASALLGVAADVAVVALGAKQYLPGDEVVAPILPYLAGALLAAMIVILILPRTRRHFRYAA